MILSEVQTVEEKTGPRIQEIFWDGGRPEGLEKDLDFWRV